MKPTAITDSVNDSSLNESRTTMAIGEFCTRQVIICLPTETIAAAARLMREYHVGSLVVVAENGDATHVPVGILTDRDVVVGVVAKEVDPQQVLVRDLMRSEFVSGQETESVFQIIDRMRTRGVRRMPIVAADRSLVGIVTADDLIELLAEEMNALSSMVARERQHELDSRR